MTVRFKSSLEVPACDVFGSLADRRASMITTLSNGNLSWLTDRFCIPTKLTPMSESLGVR